MRIKFLLMLAAAAVVAPTVAQADTVSYNGAPAATYFFGNSTNYEPAI